MPTFVPRFLFVSFITISAFASSAFAQSDANGVVYATNWGTGTAGISAAISHCGATSPSPCTVVIPPAYGSGSVPGSNPDPGYAQPNTIGFGPSGSIPSNVTVIDQRGGGASTLQNNENYVYSNVASSALLNCSQSLVFTGGVYNLFCDTIMLSANDGGSNYNYSKEGLDQILTNWQALQTTLFASTEGQAIAAGIVSSHNGIGDTLGMSLQSHCHGGYVASSDEACVGMDLQVYQSAANGIPQDYTATVFTGGTGVTSVALSSSQGEGSQGAGRYLLLTTGASPSSSAITGENPPNFSVAPMSFTITGSSTLPVSTTVATLSSPAGGVNPGVVTITPNFSTHGGFGLISVGTLLCIADPYSPLEFAKVSSLNTMTSSITLTVTRPHTASAIITSGGACGSFMDLAADDVTSSTFPSMINQVVGTMLHAWPILQTNAPSGGSQQVFVAIQRGGAWESSFSQWNSTAHPNGGFTIYPGAEVYSVANSSGEQSDTFTLSPNNVNWANGASVDLPDHPSVNVSIGQWLTQQEFPGNYSGFGINYYGAVNANNEGGALAGFTNNAPNNMYYGTGGTWTPPDGIEINGDVSYDFVAGTGGNSGDINLGCSAACNHPYQAVLSKSWAGGRSNGLYMDENSGQWQLTAGYIGPGMSAISYLFRVDGLEQPTTVVPAAADGGYAKLNFNSNFQVCLMDHAGSNHCAVQGPSSSTTYDVATFNGTGGNAIQDSGVSISAFAGGQWINLSNAGSSGIGVGGNGAVVFAGYAFNAANYFSDTLAGDIVVREHDGGSIRLGVGPALPPHTLSTMQVSAATVTLSLGTKFTETSGVSTNATSGFAVLSSGTVSVGTTAIGSAPSGGSQSGDVVELTLQSCSSCGFLHIDSVSSGSGFVIKSSNASDTSAVYWMIHHLN